VTEEEALMIARAMVKELAASEALHLLVKEIAIASAAEQDRLRKEGVPKEFVALCRLREAYVYLSGGQVKVQRPGQKLDEQTLHILSQYREEIRDYLKAHPGQQRRPPRMTAAPGDSRQNGEAGPRKAGETTPNNGRKP
jgi:hypothetical protein